MSNEKEGNNILDSPKGRDVEFILADIEDFDDWWFYPIGDNNMRKVNVYAFYRFGMRMKEAMLLPFQKLTSRDLLARLAQENQDIANYPMEAVMELVYATCLMFLEKTEGYNLPKSRQYVTEIRDMGLRCWQRTSEATDDQERNSALRHFMSECRRLVTEFEDVLNYEISKLNAVVIPEKGIYDTDKLIERADEHFSEDVRKHLPNTAIFDFKEAGKCLAFDCYTAMGYHILRAVEAVALKYLETLKNAPYTGSVGFGQYVGALGNQKLNVPKRILQRLDELREFERNPIAHPEFTVEPDDALPMYNLAHGVVPMMAKEMQKLNPK